MSCSLMIPRLVLFLSVHGLLGVVTMTNAKRFASKHSQGDAGCQEDGVFHPVGSKFLTADCQMKCYCTMDGEKSCVSLCHPAKMMKSCKEGTTFKEDKELVGIAGTRKCYCLNRYCPQSTCRVKDREYKVGDSFVQKNCSERCWCGKDGRITCEPLCPKMRCPRGKRARNVDHIMIEQDEGCFCSSQQCVPDPHKCKIAADSFPHGRVFITSDCRTKCRCKKNNTKRCEPLCSTSSPVCSQDEEVITAVKYYAHKRCSCTKKRCVKKRSLTNTDD